MDAARRERCQQPGRRIDHLDGDVVAGDERAEALGDPLEDGAGIEGGEDLLGDLEQFALAADLALEGGRLLPEAFGRLGVGHGLRREARVDDEQAQVVVAELVKAQLGQDEDAEDPILEGHRGEEHGLVEVVLGPRDRVGARIRGGVRQVLGDAVRGDPARDALADLDPQLVRRLVLVLADLALAWRPG